MGLYLVSRTDSVGYDEHDSVIVRAKNAEGAAALVLENSSDGPWHEDRLSGFTADSLTVTKITVAGERGVLLASFNAG